MTATYHDTTTLPNNLIIDDTPADNDTTIEIGTTTDSEGGAVRTSAYFFPACEEGAFVGLAAGGAEIGLSADKAEEIARLLIEAARTARGLEAGLVNR